MMAMLLEDCPLLNVFIRWLGNNSRRGHPWHDQPLARLAFSTISL